MLPNDLIREQGVVSCKIVKVVFSAFGFFFLTFAMYSDQYGMSWLMDVLWKRFDVRNRSVEKAVTEHKQITQQSSEKP